MAGPMRSVTCVFVLLAACGPSSRNNGGGDDAGSNGCSPDGVTRCNGSTFETCTGGVFTPTMDCTGACDPTLGCVACQPNSTYCLNGNVENCDSTGNPGGVAMMCTGSAVCQDGQCVDLCADAAMNKSYIGCEYWAVDLDNALEVEAEADPTFGCLLTGIPGITQVTMQVCDQAGVSAGACDPPNNACPAGYTCQSKSACVLDAQHSPFAIVVSNPQSRDAHVVVTGPGGQTIMQTVAAGQVLPILPQMGGIPDESLDGTMPPTRKAYEVTSDLPIVAYQFNPLDNVNVFSNDASLLIPRTAFDTDYYAMSWATLDRRTPAPGSNDYYGYVTIVAWQDNTQITVTPTVAVQASATQTSIAANTATNFTLNAFEVLNLEASGAGDLSGTHITSTNSMSFGVFGGHEAAVFGETTPPNASDTLGPCCADHLEEMLFPSSTWGMSFAITRSQSRGTNEPDYLRVMAQKAGTAVTFTPAPSATVSGNCGSLGPGQYCDVKIQGDTEISSTQPILVGHFLESAIWQDGLGGTVGTGDPSMAIAVPVEQFRTDYTILVPMAYDMNYVSIAAAPTGGVMVDGTAATLTNYPGGGTHRAARVPLTAGQHTIHCPDGCGVTVYGYSSAVSYMFAGGLDLKQIVIQ